MNCSSEKHLQTIASERAKSLTCITQRNYAYDYINYEKGFQFVQTSYGSQTQSYAYDLQEFSINLFKRYA